ncbi:16S rRNA (guanine(527)-N(7))-methyltransferase RsmG [Mycoplasmopsis agalactiae]|uniref:16S rRNA (guanine(527)-N(7))-methyltransferase RsmG n=1 Tax=Mycoplasmopsis agalactiae TaxID=2110 RepID=UPI00211CD34B|nr:16S rRNA (guanine(527)-N(7))-methyltransferase RsmG [Mycoplasmopsis agalactiae]UUM25714.1 16S rRNA (guanine(527)-N(7))-methyltransferase RsmG [Mycoplasmopsis agalactiae]
MNINKEYLLDKYSKQIPLLYKYAQMIYEQNKVMNICGFDSIDEIFNQGILGSILVFENAISEYNLDFKGKKILDIGAGAGFPSVPLLIALDNEFELVIIESIAKRCAFLETIKTEFKLNLTIINDRAENVNSYNSYFDYVCARALGSVIKIYLMANHHLAQNGCFILPKGKNYQDEVAEFQAKFNLEKGNITFFEYEDKINNEHSSLVVVKKTKPTPRGWPWKWAKIKNY